MAKTRASNTAPLSPGDAADLVDRVLQHADAWLTRDAGVIPAVSLGWPDDHPQVVLRREDEQRREQAQARLLSDGGLLAGALVAYDLDPAPLVTLLNHTKPGECLWAASKAEATWPQARVALQIAALRLRRINIDGDPSMLRSTDRAGREHKAEVPTQPPDDSELRGEWNALTDRQRNCLGALHESRAFDADSRRCAKDIAASAEGRDAKAAGFKEPLSNLVVRKLTQRKTGRKGGYWLTARGRELLAAAESDVATGDHSS